MKKGRALLSLLMLCFYVSVMGCGAPEELSKLFVPEPESENEAGAGSADIGDAGSYSQGQSYDVVEKQAVEDSAGAAVQYEETVTKLCREIQGLTQQELEAWERLGMNDQSVEALQKSQSGLYYYEALDERQQLLYAEILMILNGVCADIIISDTDEDRIDTVFQAVLADHPEIFYVTGYTYTKHILNDAVQRIGFSGTYTMGSSEVEAMRLRISEYAQQCMEGLPSGDDYDRIKYLYEYIIERTDYVLDAPENQNILSVLLYGQSVCQGYAKAFEYLCRYCGLEATLVTGAIRESGFGHAWNLVQSDGAYYYVDVTWGDASYASGSGQTTQQIPSVNYDYLCITTDQLCITHEINTVVPMPVCNSMEDNYYVRENAYFTALDEEALTEFMESCDLEQEDYVSFKCASDEVFEQYYEYLVTDQNIFRYLNSDAGISYSVNEDTDTLSFWIP